MELVTFEAFLKNLTILTWNGFILKLYKFHLSYCWLYELQSSDQFCDYVYIYMYKTDECFFLLVIDDEKWFYVLRYVSKKTH